MKSKISIILTLMFLLNICFSGNVKVNAETNVPIKFSSISIDKTKATAGESIKITLTIEKGTGQPGDYAYFYYIRPDGLETAAALSYNGIKYEGKIDIDSSNPSGTYEAHHIVFYDSNYPYIEVYNSSISNINVTKVDLTNAFFDVYGTNVDLPVLKSFSVDKTTIARQEYTTIRVEATSKSAPSNDFVNFYYLDPSLNNNENSRTLQRVSQSYGNGIYTSVYERKFNSDVPGLYKISRIAIYNNNQFIVVRNSPDSRYWKDLNSYNITITDTVIPGPKIISTNVENNSSNIPLNNELILTYDKNISISDYHMSSLIKIQDDGGNQIPFKGSYTNNILKLNITNGLKYNTHYKLTIPKGIIVGEDGPVSESDFTLDFTTGDGTTIPGGPIKNIISNTEISSSANFDGNLIIAPGTTLKILKGASLTVKKDLIVYGTLINEGTLSVNGNLYVNNYNDQQIGNPSVNAGKYVNTGINTINAMIIGNYPKPFLTLNPNSNIETASSKIDIKLISSPLLNYVVNGVSGSITKDCFVKQSVNLNFGQNILKVKVTDPFGNTSEKSITINNTSSPLKILGTYPVNNQSGVPLYGQIIIKFNKAVNVAPDALILNTPFQQSITPKMDVKDDILTVYYDPIFYDANYTLTIKAGKVTDNEYNSLEKDYVLNFKTGQEYTRLSGIDRYSTSIKISQNGWYYSDYVVLATGNDFPDALSIASYAAFNQIPILLTPYSKLPASTVNYIKSNSIANSYVIGGSGVISDAVMSSLPSPQRIAGRNRYETNLEALSTFEFDFTNTFIATGSNFPDALAGSALAGLLNSPMILVNDDMPADVIDVLKDNRHIMKMKYILGGTGVVSENILARIFKQ